MEILFHWNKMDFETEVTDRESSKPYQSFFDVCPSALIQQSVLWSDIICPLSSDFPYFVLARETKSQEVVGGLPLYLFQGEIGPILTSVPHAGPMGGCIVSPSLPPEKKKAVYNQLLERALSLAQEKGCLSLTIISNPFSADEALYTSYRPPTYLLKNFCQVVDLETIRFDKDGEISVGLSSLNNNLRRNIHRASDRALSVRWGSLADFDQWYRIHEIRHRELNAPALPRGLLSRIIEYSHREKRGGLAILEKNKEIVGGGIFVWNKDIADVYILSSPREVLADRGNYLIVDFAIKEMKERSIRILNWQSCKRGSGVYNFKKGWGSRELEYSFLTWTFPGFAKILEEDVSQIPRLYPWHYVAPFQALQERKREGTFLKSP
jgi:hypothetical protein